MDERGEKKMIRDPVKKLIHDKVFWVSIGISFFLWILLLIFVEYVKNETTVYEIALGFGFF